MVSPGVSVTSKKPISRVISSNKGEKNKSEMEILLNKEFKLENLPADLSNYKIKKDNDKTYLVFGKNKYEIVAGRILSKDDNKKIKWIMSGSDIYNGSGDWVASIDWYTNNNIYDDNYNVNNRKGEKIGTFYKSWAPAGSCGFYSLKDINGKFSIVSSYGDFDDINFLVNDKEKIVYILPENFSIEK